MKKNNIRFISGLSALLVLASLTGCSSRKKIEKLSNEFMLANEQIENIPRYTFHYETDTFDVQGEIDKLGISNNCYFPREMYKVIRYIDYNHIERIGIVKVIHCYDAGIDKKVESEHYEVYDVFNNNYIFSYNKNNEIDSSEVLDLMFLGDIDNIRDIVISKGMDSMYTDSVLSMINDRNSLLLSNVAEVYVLLVNSSNRLRNNIMQLKMGNY